MEAKQVAQQEAERARFVVEKVSVQPDGGGRPPRSPTLGLPVCWVACKLLGCHLLFRDHRKGLEGTALRAIGSRAFGARWGRGCEVPLPNHRRVIYLPCPRRSKTLLLQIEDVFSWNIFSFTEKSFLTVVTPVKADSRRDQMLGQMRYSH